VRVVHWCWGAIVVVASGCGRLGFGDGESRDAASRDGNDLDAALDDAGPLVDAPLDSTPAACADIDLGSAVGTDIAMGSTTGQGNDYSGCGGGTDVSFAWVAPASATYVVDACNSSLIWSSMLSVRDGTCTGAELDCDSVGCSPLMHGRVALALTAGQPIVIIIDGASPLPGSYRLSITQM
jgi:hypothetical protein